jgi:hypothetical protein
MVRAGPCRRDSVSIWSSRLEFFHHNPDPRHNFGAARRVLKSGGRRFVWVYGRDGNKVYSRIAEPLRRLTVTAAAFSASWLHLTVRIRARRIHWTLSFHSFVDARLRTKRARDIFAAGETLDHHLRSAHPTHAKFHTMVEAEALLVDKRVF